jgi:hypothetical protein
LTHNFINYQQITKRLREAQKQGCVPFGARTPVFGDPFNFRQVLIIVGNLEAHMNDVIYIGLTVLFFALTYGLIVVCERLMEEKP